MSLVLFRLNHVGGMQTTHIAHTAATHSQLIAGGAPLGSVEQPVIIQQQQQPAPLPQQASHDHRASSSLVTLHPHHAHPHHTHLASGVASTSHLPPQQQQQAMSRGGIKAYARGFGQQPPPLSTQQQLLQQQQQLPHAPPSAAVVQALRHDELFDDFSMHPAAQPLPDSFARILDQLHASGESPKVFYRKLKRQFKLLVYVRFAVCFSHFANLDAFQENECYQTELRNSQRHLLKLSRDKNFLLDRLLLHENVDAPSEDSDADSDATIEEKPKAKKCVIEFWLSNKIIWPF